jgi:hypothetical protein
MTSHNPLNKSSPYRLLHDEKVKHCLHIRQDIFTAAVQHAATQRLTWSQNDV